MQKDVIIIGGGAAGIMCAITTKLNNPLLKVLIIEQNEKIGKKLLKTGNGKCNIDNVNIDFTKYNDFSLLKENQNINLEETFLEIGLVLKKDLQGRMYPYSESASSVLECLYNKCLTLGIEIICNSEVKKIQKSTNYKVTTINDTFESKYLVVATGSIAQEKTNGYKLMESLNHKVTDLRPGLTYLKVEENILPLQGLRIKCHCNNYNLDGEMLFKEKAISGIITLEISRFIKEKQIISFDLVKDLDDKLLVKVLQDPLKGLLGLLPKMIAFDVYNRANKKRENIINILRNYTFTVFPPKDFSVAQITIGGVDLININNDFSSKIYKDLYVIGEVLNVDGATGGYNLHFAWIGGIVAARSICQKENNN